MTEKIIRFGVIGCGLMAREFASATQRWMHLTNMAVRPRLVADRRCKGLLPLLVHRQPVRHHDRGHRLPGSAGEP